MVDELYDLKNKYIELMKKCKENVEYQTNKIESYFKFLEEMDIKYALWELIDLDYRLILCALYHLDEKDSLEAFHLRTDLFLLLADIIRGYRW